MKCGFAVYTLSKDIYGVLLGRTVNNQRPASVLVSRRQREKQSYQGNNEFCTSLHQVSQPCRKNRLQMVIGWVWNEYSGANSAPEVWSKRKSVSGGDAQVRQLPKLGQTLETWGRRCANIRFAGVSAREPGDTLQISACSLLLLLLDRNWAAKWRRERQFFSLCSQPILARGVWNTLARSS